MRVSLTIALVLAGLHIVAAGTPTPGPDQLCLDACLTALSLSTFAGSPSIADGYYIEECRNRLVVQSIYACARRYCPPGDIPSSLIYFDDVCETYAYVPPLPFDLVANLTDLDINQLPTVALGDSSILNVTTVPDNNLYELGYRSEAVWYWERDVHLSYSKAMFIFWGAVMFIGAICNAMAHFKMATAPRYTQGIWRKIHAHLVLAPTFNQHCDTPIYGAFTVPPRLESIVIFLSVALNIILGAISYEVFPDNLNYPQPYIQLTRYIADRVGYLAYANIPIFWMFGIRNNILAWATGWHFATFSRFHRWVAAIATVEAVIHSALYTVLNFQTGDASGYALSWTETYWYTGGIATISMSLAVGFAALWVRIRAYDLFLLVHLGLAIMVLVNLFYHTSIFLGEYDGFLWPGVALLVLERVFRAVRIVYNVISGSGLGTLTYDEAADLIRIEVDEALGPYTRARAGGHCFVYMINHFRFWESHPFTIVRWRNVGGISMPQAEESAALSGDLLEKTEHRVTTHHVEESPTYRYTLMIRPHKGFTSRLAVQAHAGPSRSPRLLFEAPYGPRVTFPGKQANTLILIGGSGISVAIAAIYELLERYPKDKSVESPNIHLVWAVRRVGMLNSVLSRELRSATSHVRIEAFITRGEGIHETRRKPGSTMEQTDMKLTNKSILGRESMSAGGSKDSKEIERNTPTTSPVDSTGDKPGSAIVHTTVGRPDIWGRVREASSAGPLYVVACGPGSLMEDARGAVRAALRDGREVQAWLPSFGW